MNDAGEKDGSLSSTGWLIAPPSSFRTSVGLTEEKESDNVVAVVNRFLYTKCPGWRVSYKRPVTTQLQR